MTSVVTVLSMGKNCWEGGSQIPCHAMTLIARIWVRHFVARNMCGMLSSFSLVHPHLYACDSRDGAHYLEHAS